MDLDDAERTAARKPTGSSVGIDPASRTDRPKRSADFARRAERLAFGMRLGRMATTETASGQMSELGVHGRPSRKFIIVRAAD